MDQNNFNNYHNDFNNNPTERPGYSSTRQNANGMRYPVAQKQKSRFGLGIVIGILIMVVVGIVGFFCLGFFNLFRVIPTSSSVSGGTDTSGYESKLNLIQQYLDAYYMGEYTGEDMENALANGMIDGIGDKYAKYYSPKEYKEFLEGVAGNYSGIGVSVAENEDGRIEVYKVFENTPASEAGIQVGDCIIKVNGDTGFETVDDLVALVRGESGTGVSVTILREGEELEFDLVRADVSIPSVAYTMLDNNIGYIEITEFDTATVEQFDHALTDLENQGAESVIFDMRDNPGGDYDSVVAIADRVLPEGIIISTKDKNGTVKSENSDEAHKLMIPCVAIVNENSASATELFTGALQDYGIATVVGTTTYGKGVVQSIFSLPDGSGMKFTTETYYTPNGRDINGVGIQPDVEVELPEDAFEDGVLEKEEDTQLQKAIELLTVN